MPIDSSLRKLNLILTYRLQFIECECKSIDTLNRIQGSQNVWLEMENWKYWILSVLKHTQYVNPRETYELNLQMQSNYFYIVHLFLNRWIFM